MSGTGYAAALLSAAQIVCFLLLALAVVSLSYIFWPYPQARGVAAFGADVQREYEQVHAQASAALKRRIGHTNRWTHRLVFVRTGWQTWLSRKPDKPGGGNAMAFFDQLPMALYHICRLFSLRLAILREQAVWIGLVLVLAAADGWAGRARRRHTGALESALICRHAGLAAVIISSGLMFIYPLTPWPVNHNAVFTTSLVLLGFAVRFYICYFRKYI